MVLSRPAHVPEFSGTGERGADGTPRDRSAGGRSDRRGVEYVSAEVQPPSGRGRWIRCGRRVASGFAPAHSLYSRAAAWLPANCSQTCFGRRIYPTRQEVLFFAPPAGRSAFSFCLSLPGLGRLYRSARSVCGSRTWKAAVSNSRSIATAFHSIRDSGDRTPGTQKRSLRRIRSSPERFPAAAGCGAYLNSASASTRTLQNGDFLIDRHPELENVWLVGRRIGPRIQTRSSGRRVCRRTASSCTAQRPSRGFPLGKQGRDAEANGD